MLLEADQAIVERHLRVRLELDRAERRLVAGLGAIGHGAERHDVLLLVPARRPAADRRGCCRRSARCRCAASRRRLARRASRGGRVPAARLRRSAQWPASPRARPAGRVAPAGAAMRRRLTAREARCQRASRRLGCTLLKSCHGRCPVRPLGSGRQPRAAHRRARRRERTAPAPAVARRPQTSARRSCQRSSPTTAIRSMASTRAGT